MDYEPEESCLDFISDPGHIPDVTSIVSLPVSQQYITMMLLLPLSFLTVQASK